MATLIQLRRDTSANWSSNNPILSSGEIGIATDLQQFKIGNSASSWNQLEYVNAIPSQYLSLIAASANFLNKLDASTIYAPLGSASFVGVPTAPTATAGTNTHQIATTAFVRTEVTNLIDSAPGALDTLNELAAALGDDPNYAVSTASYIATKLDINNASATYLSISNAALTYVPISASSNIVDNYIPISSSYAYLTRDDASSLYIPITASGPYLTELEASALYVPISASANVVENYIPISSSYAYLTRSDAENTYIPISSSAEYLTESEAQGIYVPISSSANIVENYIPVSASFAYLTRSDAESTYIPITASAEYLTESEAQDIYVPISSSANIVENYIPVSSSYAYLTRVDAENTYIPISSSAEYLTEFEAAGIYVPISASSNIRTGLLEQSEAANVYAPLSSASLTGVPVAPTATAGTNTKQIATTEFVRTEITNLVDSAPGTLDTLNELAAALGDDPNFATSTASAIGQRLLASTASTLYMSIGSTANHATSASSINWTGVTAKPTLITSVTAGTNGITIAGTATDPTVSLNAGASVSWSNVSSKPSPIIGVELLGDVTGAASATLSQLANGQIFINTTVAANSVALGTDTTGNYVANVTAGNGITISGTAGEGWSPTIAINSSASVDWGNVSNKPDPIVGVSLTGAITGAASATLTDLTNGQISVTTSYGAISTNAQTGTSYTLALSDAGKIIEMNNAAANLVVIPLNSTVAFPTGTKIDIIQTGAGATSASIVSGVTLNSEAGKRKVNAQWQAATLVKRATDTWVMIGAIKA